MADENEILNNNKLAMKYLQEDNFKAAQYLLKESEEQIHNLPSGGRRDYLLSITYNNFGCLYKKRNQPKVALEYLKISFKLDESSTETSPLEKANSQLNISALYSTLNSHSRAFKYAKLALKTLEDVPRTLVTTTSLAIAYFNAAVELEHLNRLEEALYYYKTGLDLASKELGENNSLTLSLAKALKDATFKHSHQTNFYKNRQEIRNRMRVAPHTVRRNPIRRISIQPNTPKVKLKDSPRKSVGDKTWRIYNFRHSLPYKNIN